MKKTLKIEGMHCAGCVNSVEKALSNVEGVKNVSVNLAIEKALVEYSNGEVSEQLLRQAVQDSGYEIEQESEDNSTADITGKKSLRLPDPKCGGHGD